jgi:peptidoglycan/xylan/chitin deacetylase (PgdA/CDA1 family)
MVLRRVFKLLTLHRIILLIALVMQTGLVACTYIESFSKHSSANVYKSEDYIVYQLTSATPPSELAERFLGDDKKSWLIEESNPGSRFNTGDSIVIPLNHYNRGGLHTNGVQTVPILTYHRFSKDCSSALCVSSSIFEHQMKYLKENDFHVISPAELLAFLKYQHGLPKKSVLITMDDGYRSVYTHAYPILKKYGFTATLFIYTDFVGVSKMAVTWDQLREMKADGFYVGSHTMYHSDLTVARDGESEAEWLARIEKELYESKKIIDKKLGQDTYVLAYPYGNYDQRSAIIAREAGYKIAMSVKRGGNPFFANPLRLRRDQILRKDMQTFISRLNTFKSMSLK